MNAHTHIGSCGWIYEDWRGSFYPGDLPRKRWLAWYAHRFNTVEIDATFHGSPSAEAVAHWLAAAPAHFRFTAKAPRAMTHTLRLRRWERALEGFLAAMQPLQSRLGAVLVQLPQSFQPGADAGALRDFVLHLPHGWRFAIEFGNPEWHQPRFVNLLEESGVSWVWTDRSPLRDQERAPFELLPETADFLYVRLIGDLRTRGAGRVRYRQRLWSRAAALENWAVRLGKPEVKNVYILCGNHFEGFAPATCRELGAAMGLSAGRTEPEPIREKPRQLQLL
ncbi:MAG TPA: DUF72 domain-containing protein [Chthoniobacteraceae bacterium]|nr:DUF72 domain-containing protein [Chthoniobacteraceae bacterium]